jgi:hypothetical protein
MNQILLRFATIANGGWFHNIWTTGAGAVKLRELARGR